MRLFWCLGFGLLTSTAHATCPNPLQGAQPGWFVEAYDKRSPFDDKPGLISPPPIAAINATLPISFAQLDPGGDGFPNIAFMARIRICEQGSYEFYTFVQQTGRKDGTLDCRMTTRVNGSRLTNTNQSVEVNELLTSPGRITLEPGWAEVRLSLSCGGSSALAMYRPTWRNKYFTAKVRGPSDNLQRDFAPEEIVNLGRGTLAAQAGSPRASEAPPPPVVAPAAIPEQREGFRSPQKSRQNLQFN